nr:DUF3352 domain-containing protein [Acaryochloris sp. IP29b_bin.137]
MCVANLSLENHESKVRRYQGVSLVDRKCDRKKATATFAKLDTFAQQNKIKVSNSKIGDVQVTHWQVPPLGFPISWKEVTEEETNGKLPWEDFRDWLL